MTEISWSHPRAESLRIRKKLVDGFRKGLVTPDGLSAHGRGEAFDYLIGEKTIEPAEKATLVAAAEILRAENPIFSVNGNVSALVSEEISNLSDNYGINVEINLFHQSEERKKRIAEYLGDCGIEKVLGIKDEHLSEISEIESDRRIVDERGQESADLIVVPLEDGDRTEALVDKGKKVIAIDLNPLSRTSEAANVTIVDNIVRALPNLMKKMDELKASPEKISKIIDEFDNEVNLRRTIEVILNRLKKLSSE